jgi:uncharacterized protein YkwD
MPADPHHARRPRGPAARLAPSLLLALLAACGGGGDGGDSAAPGASTTTAPPADGQAVQAAPPPALAASESCGIADFAVIALERVNQRRAAGARCGSQGSFAPAAPLRWNALLAQAAAAHSADMAAQDYFSHTSLDGRSVAQRVDATGYVWSALGENIAAGYPSIDAVVDGWMGSDGHCANLMNPAFDEIGMACVAGGSYRSYWTQDLARAR